MVDVRRRPPVCAHHAANFTRWKEHSPDWKAFERVLRGFKAREG